MGNRPITLSCTATNTITNDTSEFSEAVAVEDDPPPPPDPQCSDGVDNDADDQTDFPDDTDCSSGTDAAESPDAPAGCTIVGTNGNDLANGGEGNDSCSADRNDRKKSCT